MLTLRSVFIRFRRIILIIIFIILIILSTLIGVLDINLKDLILLNKESWNYYLYFRVPRTLSIVLSASGIAVSGLIMQQITKNKFISPTTGGTISASKLGMLIGLLFLGNQSLVTRLSFSFIFALGFSILFIFILNRIKFNNIIYVPLIGMMYGSIISSFTNFIASSNNLLQTVQSWDVGSFSLLVKGRYELLFIIIIPVVLSIIFSTRFSIVGFGEDFSKNLGINYRLTVFIGLLLVSLVSSITYIMVGPLPFLGLIIPNIVRMYYGDNIKRSIIDIMLISSIFILICDILSRLIRYPYELPISFISGFIGGIIFLIILFKNKHEKN